MRFDYLTPALGPVIEGFEDDERIYARDQAQYRPIRALLGERGNSAIYRCELTPGQRQMIYDGADVLVEIVHFGGPLAPSRVMLLNQAALEKDQLDLWREWLRAQLQLVELGKLREASPRVDPGA